MSTGTTRASWTTSTVPRSGWCSSPDRTRSRSQPRASSPGSSTSTSIPPAPSSCTRTSSGRTTDLRARRAILAAFFTEVPKMPALARSVLSGVVAFALAATGSPQNRIDGVTPLAPELAAYGPQAIGVRTLRLTDANRPDVLNTKEGGPTARYERPLTVEVWYPATLASGQDGQA